MYAFHLKDYRNTKTLATIVHVDWPFKWSVSLFFHNVMIIYWFDSTDAKELHENTSLEPEATIKYDETHRQKYP